MGRKEILKAQIPIPGQRPRKPTLEGITHPPGSPEESWTWRPTGPRRVEIRSDRSHPHQFLSNPSGTHRMEDDTVASSQFAAIKLEQGPEKPKKHHRPRSSRRSPRKPSIE